MSGAMEVRSATKPSSELLPVLKPGGNRPRVSKSLESERKKDDSKNSLRTTARLLRSGLNLSADLSSTSDSFCSRSSVRTVDFRRRRMHSRVKSVKVVPESVDVSMLSSSPLLQPQPVLVKRRCAWITPNSDPLYVSFHDEEWGVPVHDDRKLFELLVLSEALAELSWPTILNKRDSFRNSFENFDPSTVAKFTEKKILSLKTSGSVLLSELKLRAVVENAKQMLKIIEEFGSFSYYCWSLVNHKPISNGFRYARQVPIKIPKAETISKDLMKRGFRCVGPTIIYSFMQATGIVNDHLSSCFRYEDCNSLHVKESKTNIEETITLGKVLDKACSFTGFDLAGTSRLANF